MTKIDVFSGFLGAGKTTLIKKLLKEADAFSTEADTKILSCKTARDAERVLKLEGMAEIYERARYSNLESSAEDVRKMKSVLQRSTHRN